MTHQYEQMSWVVYQYYHIFILAPNSWWIFKRLGKQRQSAVTKSILIKFDFHEACKVDELSIKWHGTWLIDCTMSRQQVATTNTSLQTIVCFFLWRNDYWKEGYFVKWYHSLRKKEIPRKDRLYKTCLHMAFRFLTELYRFKSWHRIVKPELADWPILLNSVVLF